MGFRHPISAMRSDERVRRIALSAVTSALSRALAVLVPLIVVKVALERLGTETYGLWMATASLFSLFAFADLGLGSGLQTRLARLYGTGDSSEARGAISSAAVVLSAVAVLLASLFALSFPLVPWRALLNVESTQTAVAAEAIVAAIVLSRIASVPLGLVQRVQFAFQEGYASNLWMSAASVLSIAAVYVVVGLNAGPEWIIWGSTLVPVVVTVANYAFYFLHAHPELRPTLGEFRRTEAAALIRVGLAFMMLSVLTAVGLSMDSYIVARTCGVEAVAAYSIGFRIATVLGVATTMLSTPMWAANGEALAKQDYAWVKRTTRRISLLSLLITLAISAAFLLWGNWLIGSWIDSRLTVPVLLMAGLLLTQVVQAFISPYFMVLNGAGIVRKQVWLFALYTPISLALKYWLSSAYGAVAIPWTGAVLYTGMIAVPVFVIARGVYSRKYVPVNRQEG